MTTTEMNFGPEWLRALQDGMPKGSNSNSSSSSMSNSTISGSTFSKANYKNATVKYRYSCSEMLSHYNRRNCSPPKDLMEHDEVFVDKTQDPLAFTELSSEEINLLSQNINCDYLVKKTKENGETERQPDYRERSIELERETRPSKLLNTSGGDMIGRKPPGFASVNPSGLMSGNSLPVERGNGHQLRSSSGRGGALAERSRLRSTGSLFSRVSSYEETAARSNLITSNSILNVKKTNLQRSATESNSNVSASNLSNTFIPTWRSGVALTSGSSSSSANSNATTAEQKTEWRNSDVSKNWRSSESNTNLASGSKGGIGPHKIFTKDSKDLFDTEDSSGSWDNSRDYVQRKRISNQAKSNKSFVRNRFETGDSNDLFKTKSSYDTFDSFEVDDRDLFASGSRMAGSGYSNSNNNADLFGRNKQSQSSVNGVGRFARGERGTEYGGHGDSKWNKQSHNNERDRYSSFNRSNQNYHRFNSHNHDDDGDRFGHGLCSDEDDDYRRNSLPEWSLEDPSSIDITKVGTFDASGAFHEALDDDYDKSADESRRKEKPEIRQKKQDIKPRELAQSGNFDEKSSYDDDNQNDSKHSTTRFKAETQINQQNTATQQPVKSTASEAKENFDFLKMNELSSGSLTKESLGHQYKEEDSLAQLEKDTQKMLNLDAYDDNDATALLSSQLSMLLKEDESLVESLKGRPGQQMHIAPNHSVNNSAAFLQDRFHQSNSSQQSSMFSVASMINRLHEEKSSNASSTEKADHLNSHILSQGKREPQHLGQILDDNFGFKFDSNSITDSSAEHTGQTNPSSTHFSNLGDQVTTSREMPSYLQSAISLEAILDDQPSDILGNTRISQDYFQKKQKPLKSNKMETVESAVAGPTQAQLIKTPPVLDEESNKWFYRDPQGKVQGPFASSEMCEWFANGYFKFDLQVRRACDSNFCELGDLLKASGGQVPFITMPASFMLNTSESNSNPLLFNSSMLSDSSVSHSQMPVPPSPSFLHQGQPSPQLHPTAGGNSHAHGHHPDTFDSLLNGMNKVPNSESFISASSIFSNNQPLKEENMSAPVTGNSSMLNSLFQRQQSQPHIQPQSATQVQPDSQIASLLNIQPQNQMLAQNQLRLILSELMKSEQFIQLSTVQQQQIVMEKFIELNNQSGLMGLGPQFSSAQPPSEQLVRQQSLTINRVRSVSPTLPTNVSHDDIHCQQQPQQQQQQHAPLLNEQPSQSLPEKSFTQHKLATPPPPQEPSAVSVELSQQSQPKLDRVQSVIPPSSAVTETVRNPLNLLHAAMASGSPSTWENLVPGAMSLSAVEELQRREAEERYRINEKKESEQEVKENDFIEAHPKGKRSKGKQHEAQIKSNKPAEDNNKSTTPAVSASTSSKVQLIDSKPTHEEEDKPSLIQQLINSEMQQQQIQSASLPKKSVWGKASSDSPALSLAEIQKLQEEKEREEEEARQGALQEQMASFLAGQSQAQQSTGRSPLKWASATWQEQNNSNIKTLAEIQAEEAERVEKAAQLRNQQEAEAMRRMATNASKPLAAILAQSVSGAAWNNSNSQLFSGQKTGSVWEEVTTPISTPANATAVTKAAPAKATKVDSTAIKKVLKTNPRNIKKIEEAQLMKVGVNTYDELYRHSSEVLEKNFDQIDVPGFIAILKDTTTPNEVVDYVQNYLGHTQSAKSFAKFFISRKSFLVNKCKQENVERAKQQTQLTNRRPVASWEEEEEEASFVQQNFSTSNVNYKMALNQGQATQQKKSNSTQSHPTKTKANQAKVKTSTPITVAAVNCDNEANIMNVPVETMEQFDSWCIDVIKHNFDQKIDAETFISFLKYLDSPFEINDYVQTYLGNSKISRDFVKNFISKRSYLRNKNKAQQQEDMCGPAPALNPSVKSSGEDYNGFVTVNSSNKKKRKGKGQQGQQQQGPTLHTTTLD